MHFQQSITFSGGTDPILDVFPPDYKMFVLRVGTGVDIDYIILSETGLQWEIGVGQLAVGGAFTRDTVTENSLGTFVKVDFNLGRHTVIVQEQSAGGLSDGDYGDVTVSGSGTVLTLDMTEALYDNSTSGLTATDVQDAIDELAASSSGGTVKIDVGTCSSDGGLALSTDKRTVTVSSSTVGSICTDLTFGGDGGKYYCEYEIIDDGSGGGPQCSIGVETPYGKRVSRGFTGEGSSSWAYWNNGNRYTAGSPSAYGSTYTSGDIVGWAVDQTAGSIWFHKNGVFVGDPVAGTGSAYTDNKLKLPLHGALCPYTNTASIRLRIASEYSYSPPAGFSASYS